MIIFVILTQYSTFINNTHVLSCFTLQLFLNTSFTIKCLKIATERPQILKWLNLPSISTWICISCVLSHVMLEVVLKANLTVLQLI